MNPTLHLEDSLAELGFNVRKVYNELPFFTRASSRKYNSIALELLTICTY
jgi:hypothetical protein